MNREKLYFILLPVATIIMIIIAMVFLVNNVYNVSQEEQDFCKSLGYDSAEYASHGNLINCKKEGETQINQFGRANYTSNKFYECKISYTPNDINTTYYKEPRCMKQ